MVYSGKRLLYEGALSSSRYYRHRLINVHPLMLLLTGVAEPVTVVAHQLVMEAVRGPLVAVVFGVVKVAVPGPLVVVGIGQASVAVRGPVMVAAPGLVTEAGLGLVTVAWLGVAIVTGFTKGGVFSARVLASMASAIRGGGTIRTIRITAVPIMAKPYYGNPYYENSYPQLSDLRAVQAALAQRGYYRGPIDGVYGPETRNAIRSFQAHQGLTVTGQVDGRLIRALQS